MVSPRFSRTPDYRKRPYKWERKMYSRKGQHVPSRRFKVRVNINQNYYKDYFASYHHLKHKIYRFVIKKTMVYDIKTEICSGVFDVIRIRFSLFVFF